MFARVVGNVSVSKHAVTNVVSVHDCKKTGTFGIANRILRKKPTELFQTERIIDLSQRPLRKQHTTIIDLSQRPLRTQHTTNTTDEHPCPSAELEPAIPAVERLQTAKNTDFMESEAIYRHLLKYAKAFTAVKSKVIKVKVTLEQATKDQRGSRGIALLSL